MTDYLCLILAIIILNWNSKIFIVANKFLQTITIRKKGLKENYHQSLWKRKNKNNKTKKKNLLSRRD
jgi:hypothetical protein